MTFDPSRLIKPGLFIKAVCNFIMTKAKSKSKVNKPSSSSSSSSNKKKPASFTSITFPHVRRVFPGLITQQSVTSDSPKPSKVYDSPGFILEKGSVYLRISDDIWNSLFAYTVSPGYTTNTAGFTTGQNSGTFSNMSVTNAPLPSSPLPVSSLKASAATVSAAPQKPVPTWDVSGGFLVLSDPEEPACLSKPPEEPLQPGELRLAPMAFFNSEGCWTQRVYNLKTRQEETVALNEPEGMGIFGGKWVWHKVLEDGSICPVGLEHPESPKPADYTRTGIYHTTGPVMTSNTLLLTNGITTNTVAGTAVVAGTSLGTGTSLVVGNPVVAGNTTGFIVPSQTSGTVWTTVPANTGVTPVTALPPSGLPVGLSVSGPVTLTAGGQTVPVTRGDRISISVGQTGNVTTDPTTGVATVDPKSVKIKSVKVKAPKLGRI